MRELGIKNLQRMEKERVQEAKNKNEIYDPNKDV